MTQQATNKNYHTFVKGIITEAGPLSFPENASLDEENCVLNRDGSRQRRLGFDFENGFDLHTVTLADDDAVASFLWENAANAAANQFAVVQAGKRILIFDTNQHPISDHLLANLDLSAYITGKTVISGVHGLGYFFIDEGSTNPVYIAFNGGTSFSVGTLQIRIRDIFGVDDGLSVDNQPASLSVAHHYNLLNQGWPEDRITLYKAENTINPTSVYPANSQQWWVGKDTDDNFQAILLKKHDFGSTPAPKGRFIIDAFTRSTSRNAATGLTTASDIETGRPSVVGFGFERLFHAGVSSNVTAVSETRPNMTGFVFYSRVLRSLNDANQYHTDADPSAEMDSDLVDTDGGFINIPNSGPIYKLIQKENAMVIFAQHGIWALQGDDSGFSATTNQVIKLSNFGVLSGTAVVDIEDAVLYWNEGGIYLLSADPTTGRWSSRSISENTIQTLYNSISKVAKEHAVGTFDPVSRQVKWMYSDAVDYDGINFKNKYVVELVLDMSLEAFSKNTISAHPTPSYYMAGYVHLPTFVPQTEGVRSRGASETMYVALQYTNPVADSATLSFAYYRNRDFRDWFSVDGIGASFRSFALTGYEILGDSMRKKQARYLVTHCKFTEIEAIFAEGEELVPDNPSGLLVQAQWAWTNSPNAGKWGTKFQAYRPRLFIIGSFGEIDTGLAVVTNKSKLRGSGPALSLLFESDGDKDFYLHGWAIAYTGNSSV